jgi:uncharacterized membrane protein YqjE
MGNSAQTPKVLLGGFLAIVALAVVWLVDKIARTDRGDYRLAVLGITVAFVMLLVVAFGIWRRWRS